MIISAVYGYGLSKSAIKNRSWIKKLPKTLATGLISFGCIALSISPSCALEQQYKLPPIDKTDLNRCVLSSSSMGQANAARDKLFDLRECDLKGQTGAGKDMSGIILENSDLSGVNLKEAQLSKGYARKSKFIGCDFTNAIVDRVSFDGSDLSKAIFINAVLSGTTFNDANLQDTDFTDSYLGPFDLKNLCLNPTLRGTNPVSFVQNILIYYFIVDLIVFTI
jgi:uncharacterized protein YjbI with pentapeptide repeats